VRIKARITLNSLTCPSLDAAFAYSNENSINTMKRKRICSPCGCLFFG
jgi:hypothetical protein